MEIYLKVIGTLEWVMTFSVACGLLVKIINMFKYNASNPQKFGTMMLFLCDIVFGGALGILFFQVGDLVK